MDEQVAADKADLAAFVESLEVVARRPHAVGYELRTLENEIIMVDFNMTSGYTTQDDGAAYETMEALLSTRSPKYRKAFVEAVAEKLAKQPSS